MITQPVDDASKTTGPCHGDIAAGDTAPGQAKQQLVGYEHHQRRPLGAPGEIRIQAILKSTYVLPDGSISDDFQYLIDSYKTDPNTIKLMPLYAPMDGEHKDGQADSLNYKSLYEQMCNRCDDLDRKLAEFEAQEPIGKVIASVPHLRSISVELFPEGDIPNEGDQIYTTPHREGWSVAFVGRGVTKVWPMTEAQIQSAAFTALGIAEQQSQQVPVTYLANGTRFKMSFFDCDAPEGDDHGQSDVGTYVTCFEAFAKELNGRWVALVAAEDDCHLKLPPQPAQPHKVPIPPGQADMTDICFAEGWNACCDAFFGGKPPPDPLIITIEREVPAQPGNDPLKAIHQAQQKPIFSVGEGRALKLAMSQANDQRLDALKGRQPDPLGAYGRSAKLCDDLAAELKSHRESAGAEIAQSLANSIRALAAQVRESPNEE